MQLFKLQIVNASCIVIMHLNYTLIVWFSAPYMSDAIDSPHRMQSNHVSHEHLRHNSSAPSFVPQIYGYCCR